METANSQPRAEVKRNSNESQDLHNVQPPRNSSWLSSLWGFGTNLLASFLPGTQAELDPQACYDLFIQEFEREYGIIHPSFIRGSYSQACSQSKREYKFLIIYLHSPIHQNTPSFCKNTLCTQLLTEFFNEHFLCWAANINHSEGFKTSNLLQASTYPFLSVIIHNNIGGMTQIGAIQGNISTEDLLSKLTTILEEYGHLLQNSRQENREREADRQIREEQDLAYLQALAEDQERERREREERERKEKEERLLVERQQTKEKRREELSKSLPPEPSADQPNITHLVIRLTDGSRLQRRFNITDRLQTVIDFINSQNVQELDEFDLVTNFPRQVFSDPTITLQKAGLFPHASLFVQEKE